MKIARIDAWTRHVELQRPYSIALKATDAVDMVIVRIETDDGSVGLGSATPEATITGETLAMCQAALAPTAVDWLVARNLVDYRELSRSITETAAQCSGQNQGADKHNVELNLVAQCPENLDDAAEAQQFLRIHEVS